MFNLISREEILAQSAGSTHHLFGDDEGLVVTTASTGAADADH
ncbi:MULTISPECIES: hypothetical protein [Corynebacterium]|jgi:hypothetical protein|uniref:Uncharacterized protein n=1 Tax=Corynebacterium provencense TaxID=1737425 RepID=A0A2Z3YRT6_9CORY|nr:MULTISPECIES: hypothetical protein [Corynebacterium]AWT25860.1 hypothetical protein Csp1_10550 [Corynebacterium provencense]